MGRACRHGAVLVGIATWLLLVSGSALAAGSVPTDWLSRLRDARDSIEALECRELVEVEERWRGRPSRMERRASRLLFDRSTGRVTREPLVAADPPADATGAKAEAQRAAAHPKLHARPQAFPEPRWLFALPDQLGELRPSVAARGDGTLLRWRPRGRTGGPAVEILLNADRLPVRVRTFGAKGALLDEAEVAWGGAGAAPFPRRVTVVQHSLRNDVTTTVRFDAVTMRVRGRTPLASAP